MRGRCFLIRFADDVRHITGHQIPYVLLRYTIATLREKRRAEVFL
jgi:hypothetical protein